MGHETDPDHPISVSLQTAAGSVNVAVVVKAEQQSKAAAAIDLPEMKASGEHVSKPQEGPSKQLPPAVSDLQKPLPSDIKPKKAPYKWNVSNPLSYIFFMNVDGLVLRGYQDGVEQTDLLHMDMHKISNLLPSFNAAWEQQQQRGTPSVFFSTLKGKEWMLFYSGVLQFLAGAAGFVGPLLLNYTIRGRACQEYYDDPDNEKYFECDPPANTALYEAAGGLLAGSAVYVLCTAHAQFTLSKMGLAVRCTLMAAVYRKCLKLDNAAVQNQSIGKIVTIMSNDCQVVERFIEAIHSLWVLPIIIVFCLYLLYTLLEWSAFVGLGSIILLVPPIAKLGYANVTLRKALVDFTDKRINLMVDAISGIRILKFYAWEDSFLQNINAIRSKEVGVLTSIAWCQAGFGMVLFGLPILIAVSAIGSYALAGNAMDAATAFTALALFNQLRFPLAMFPVLLTSYIQFSVAMKRIADFLLCGEIPQADLNAAKDLTSGTIKIKDGQFSWDGEDPPKEEEGSTPEEKKAAEEKRANWTRKVHLADVNLEIPPGSMTMIVGSVGSGKSSLAAALIQNISKVSGEVEVKGSIAYVAQGAWILNETVQNNIVFGKPFNRERYNRVLEVSQLKPDLKILPNGDQTEIGERGVTLSGGQKQRVSIARAVYADADIYIMDDPLSAVDSHVSSALFEKVLQGELRSKTRILVTNALQFLGNADQVVVMDQGRICEKGTYTDLMTSGLDFAKLISAHSALEDELEEKGTEPGSPTKVAGDKAGRKSEDGKRKSEDGRRRSEDGKRKSEDGAKAADGKEEKSGSNNLTGEEDRQEGSVGGEVWIGYAKAAGGAPVMAMLAFLYSSDQGTRAFMDNWLAWWSDDYFDKDYVFYLGLWAIFGLVNCIAVFSRSLMFCLSFKNAAARLHQNMLNNVMRLPMHFFDTTPSGRIINRFSKDTEVMDTIMSSLMIQFVGCMFTIGTTLIVICIAAYWFVPFLFPVFGLYIVIQRLYIPTSRDLQRIESVTRSPIYATFSETLQGLVTIRAYEMSAYFNKLTDDLIELNAAAVVTQKLGQMWLNLRLETIGMSVVTGAAVLCIYMDTEPGLLGLALTYALEITKYLKHGTDMASQVESKLNAVERQLEYTDLPQEAAAESSPEVMKQLAAADWPSKGAIDVQNVIVRYRPGLPTVLNNLTFSIAAKEKVGIVGRTGSGKSSLFLALFRLMEIESGTVMIDGMDLKNLGLNQVRRAMSMIPQDPFMFVGDVRTNIDPASKLADGENDPRLWAALEKVGLKPVIENLEGKLDFQVVENGSNFSAGQRQLFCMVRALLQSSKILLLDEATASVDLETDEFIQTMVRDQFKECTVLTIAHRLNTIMDSDRAMVLSDGKVVEYDTPLSLLEKDEKGEKSFFADLVNQVSAFWVLAKYHHFDLFQKQFNSKK